MKNFANLSIVRPDSSGDVSVRCGDYDEELPDYITLVIPHG